MKIGKEYIYLLSIYFFLSSGSLASGEESKESEDSKEASDATLSEFISEIGRYRDPFDPLVGGETYDEIAIKGKIKLEGILWHSKHPLVLLNGRILKEGDEILGAKVKKIEKKRVLLEYIDQTIPLVFWETGGTEKW